MSARMDAFLRRIELVASGALFALVVLVFVSVSLRYLWGAPLKDQFDLSRMLLGVAVFWGIAAAAASDEWVRGDVFWDRLSPAARKAIDVFGRLVVVVAFVVLAWQVGFKFIDVMRAGELTSELRWPIWPFYGVMCFGSALALVGCIVRLVRVVLHRPDEVAELQGESLIDQRTSEG